MKAQYSLSRLSPGNGSAMLVNSATRRWDSCQQETDAGWVRTTGGGATSDCRSVWAMRGCVTFFDDDRQ